MTIAHQTPIVKYAYTDPDIFTFSFKILEDEDISVIHTDGSTGVSTILILNTDFTVNFNVNVQGGDVVVSFDGSDGTIEIRRDMPIEQQVDFVNNERLDMEIIERAYDRLTMLIQQYLIDLQEGTGLSNYRGEWATNTQYTAGEVVEHSPSGGSIYLAVNEHTSGVFADDLAAGNWNLFIDVGNLDQLLTDTEAAEAAALVSQTAAEAAATLASQFGLSIKSVTDANLTPVVGIGETIITTDVPFSDLLGVFYRGQLIPRTSVISQDGTNSTFTVDFEATDNDLVAMVVESQPIPTEYTANTTLNVRAAPAVGEFSSVLNAISHLADIRFPKILVTIDIEAGNFDVGSIILDHPDSDRILIKGAGSSTTTLNALLLLSYGNGLKELSGMTIDPTGNTSLSLLQDSSIDIMDDIVCTEDVFITKAKVNTADMACKSNLYVNASRILDLTYEMLDATAKTLQLINKSKVFCSSLLSTNSAAGTIATALGSRLTSISTTLDEVGVSSISGGEAVFMGSTSIINVTAASAAVQASGSSIVKFPIPPTLSGNTVDYLITPNVWQDDGSVIFSGIV